MKLIQVLLIFSFLGTMAYSRDTTLHLSINKALKKGKSMGVVDPKIRLQFGSRSLQAGQRTFTANRKTNAFNKTDTEACQWAFLSSIKSLQDRARQRGKRRVTGIVGYHNRIRKSRTSTYECHVGTIIAKVALQGNI